MKQLFLIAGMAAFAVAAPAHAQPGHAKGKGQKVKMASPWGISCPPGLAKRNNGCMPPGQAKKLYNVGQRFPLNYGNMWGYNQIPYDMRRQYGFDPNSNYYYGDGYLYRVDPTTMLIREVVSAILR